MVEGDATLDRGVEKMFQDSFQYALFSYEAKQLQVSFDSFKDNVNEGFLRQMVNRLKPFNLRDTNIIRQYRNFFRLIGTHIVTTTTYGSRLSLVSLTRSSRPILLIASDQI